MTETNSQPNKFFVAGVKVAESRRKDESYKDVPLNTALLELTGISVVIPGEGETSTDVSSQEFGEFLEAQKGHEIARDYMATRERLIERIGVDELAVLDALVDAERSTEGAENV